MAQLSATEKPINKIFSEDYTFKIPPYQRPYSWGTEQAKELFNDLYNFYSENKMKGDSADDYFLGSIVLIKKDNDPKSQVVDGQQRLTTLTILWAAMISKLSDQNRAQESERLFQKGDSTLGIAKTPRLTLREKDQPFFEKYIQNVDTQGIEKLNVKQLTEPQKHVIENFNCLKKLVEEKFTESDTTVDEESIIAFCRIILTQCYMVVVCAATDAAAFRIFSVLNSRGLELLPIDILKADIIGSMPESKRDSYTKIWEDTEEALGRDKFNQLFSHIRMLTRKVKAKDSLLDEFRKYVLPIYKSNYCKFVDEIQKYADIYSVILGKSYISEEATYDKEINDYLNWLNKIDNSDWIPVCMKFMSLHNNEPEYLKWFLGKLERLSAYMHLYGNDVNARIDRYTAILNEIEKLAGKDNLKSPLKNIELNDLEIRNFNYILNSEIYLDLNSKRRNYLILRTDSFVSDNSAVYDYSVLTIEHVLPQTPDDNSEWKKLWTDKDREKWTHRLANLVPLARRKNSAASNLSFKEKKDKYFKGSTGVSSFALTTQVLGCDDWTVSVVENRQKSLMDILKTKWEL